MPKKESTVTNLEAVPPLATEAEQPPPGSHVSLFMKMGLIASEATYLQKKGRNETQKYNYAQEADFLELVKPLLTKYGVVMLVSVESCDHKEIGESRSGTKQFLSQVKISVVFVDANSGATLTVNGFGQGVDPGDKGVYKAITGATKYVISKCFQIPTGDDPEVDVPETPLQATSAPRRPVPAGPAATPAPLAPGGATAPSGAKPVDNEKFRAMLAAEWTRLGPEVYNATMMLHFKLTPEEDLFKLDDGMKRSIIKALKAVEVKADV